MAASTLRQRAVRTTDGGRRALPAPTDPALDMRTLWFGLGAFCALAACAPAAAPSASGGTTIPAPTQSIGSGEVVHVTVSSDVRVLAHSVDAPVARVWEVLPAVYAELGLEAAVDPGRRTVSSVARFTQRVLGQPATRFFDCGRGSFGAPIASQYTVRIALSTTVNPGADDGSRLDNRLEAQAFNRSGANSAAAECRSTGRLEETIAERVRARLST